VATELLKKILTTTELKYETNTAMANIGYKINSNNSKFQFPAITQH
jgi:hypothetical protein